jgi:hypothetical protein
MKNLILVVALLGLSAPALADGPTHTITIQGSFSIQSNVQGHCGGSESGTVLSGEITSIDGQPATGQYDDCGDNVDAKLILPAGIRVRKDKNVARALARHQGEFVFTITDADVSEGYAFGGSVTQAIPVK